MAQNNEGGVRVERKVRRDHPRDCEHGHQFGKCDTCDLIEEQKENEVLAQKCERYKKALAAIMKHHESIAGDMAVISTTWNIAREALKDA